MVLYNIYFHIELYIGSSHNEIERKWKCFLWHVGVASGSLVNQSGILFHGNPWRTVWPSTQETFTCIIASLVHLLKQESIVSGTSLWWTMKSLNTTAPRLCHALHESLWGSCDHPCSREVLTPGYNQSLSEPEPSSVN